jgi:hypothetical protein
MAWKGDLGISTNINRMDREMKRKITGKSIREPIPSGMRKKTFEKAKNKCQWRGCKIKLPMPLDVHHMNLRSDDNKLSNFKVFCPTHHRMWHQQNKLKVVRDDLGFIKKRRVVRVKKTVKKKVKRKTPVKKDKRKSKYKNFFGLDMKDFGI